MKYFGILCEDEIVGLEGREVVFVSVFFVFNVIFIFYDDIVVMFFKGEFCVVKDLVGILEIDLC